MSQVVQQEALTRLLEEKGIFTKEEFLEKVKRVNEEMKRKEDEQGLSRNEGGLSRTEKGET
jgi:hypothetical protein